MAQYNLLINGFIQSSTYSGTGNLELTSSQINSLYDNDMLSSVINLSTSNILYLDIDLFNRVRISDISLYIDTTIDRDTALDKVDFYYKNDPLDSYVSIMSKAQDSDRFYLTNLPELFSPRYIRIAVSDLECSLYELKILNRAGGYRAHTGRSRPRVRRPPRR